MYYYFLVCKLFIGKDFNMRKVKKILTVLFVTTALIACSNNNSLFGEPNPPLKAKTIEYPLKGDVDCDGTVTIGDVTALIDYILYRISSPNSDVNGDGSTTIEDVTALIDLLMANGHAQYDDGNYIVNGVHFKMIDVEGGTFIMGAPNTEPASYTFEKPLHDVTLSAFSIGETEVTQELYESIMGKNPSINKSNPQNPVERVDWNDCIAFIEKLNEITGKKFRLPTEAEWEYAAIGGKYTHYYIFSGSEMAADVAWYVINSNGSSQPVKQLRPNELGLYDMSGNVYEWVNDWYARYSSDPQTNPQGPETGTLKVYRGGSWHDGAAYSRCHFRYMREITYKTQWHGFRLAM